ncbi:MAG: NAD+ synthase [Planctomycetota bacterium]
MKTALCPINPTIGDLEGNARLIRDAVERSRAADVDLCVLPELCVCGYPPRDLLLLDGFVEACEETLATLAGSLPRGMAVIVGLPLRGQTDRLRNSLVVLRDGKRIARYDKRLLPTYDVFDEDRYFESADEPVIFEHKGVRIGLSVCEDLWKGKDAGFNSRYARRADPICELGDAGAQLIINPSASPFVLGKHRTHAQQIAAHTRSTGVPIASINQLGGNDELIFHGQARVTNPDGSSCATRPFSEQDLIFDFTSGDVLCRSAGGDDEGSMAMLFDALVLGVRDYVRKTGFSETLLGLSGGIDSALTAVIAAAALGPEKVLGISMPGKYSSEHSKTDAIDLAQRLSMRIETAPIAEPFEGLRNVSDSVFDSLGERRLGETLPDLTEENLQSRVRGTLMMTISNRTGALLLTTGNKSEVAVGYSTLYGDMNGGLAVLSDVPKTKVYELSRWINANHSRCGFAHAPIPESTITKPPSAELAPEQKDSDSLPDYDTLDAIIEGYVEQRRSADQIEASTGAPPETIARVLRMIDRNEYKRKQLATGLKVTHVAFGVGRRMPIAQRWR